MTGRDLVTASLRLIGAIAPGESLAASEATDGLASLNRMISGWSNEKLLIYAITEETPLTLTPSDGSYTMGTSGDFSNRPQAIVAALIRDGTIDLPLKILTADEYAAIPLKTLESTYPTSLYDDGGYPQRTIKLFPVPNAAKSLVLFTNRILTAIATLDTDISLPPGYEEALIYNFAIRQAPEYGKVVPDPIVMIATESKASLKRANHRAPLLRCDAGLTSGGRGSFYDIYKGGTQ